MLTQQNPEMARVSPDPLPILVGVASGHETSARSWSWIGNKSENPQAFHLLDRVETSFVGVRGKS